jgi:hypothetical protein
MIQLLQRSIASVNHRMVLLAPPTSVIPDAFENVDFDRTRHADLMGDMQRLRGGVYLSDGALEPQQLTADGLHQTPEDGKSWHLLILDRAGKVSSCAWYMEHPATVAIERLRVHHSPLAAQPASRRALRTAVEADLAYARREGLGYAEVGGWAVSPASRCTSEGLILALTGYSLGRMLGGTLGMTTATVRHCSSTILRRLGGSDFIANGKTLPSYYDPRYKCQMELLRFDSRQPNRKYSSLVDMITVKLAEVLVVTAQPVAQSGYDFFAPSSMARRQSYVAAS